MILGIATEMSFDDKGFCATVESRCNITGSDNIIGHANNAQRHAGLTTFTVSNQDGRLLLKPKNIAPERWTEELRPHAISMLKEIGFETSALTARNRTRTNQATA